MPFTYKIFIIFHDTLNIQYYNASILKNLIFVNVRKDNKNRYPDLKIINLHEFKEYKPIGKYYAESEVLYNIYKNIYLIENIDYIGFLHHDFDCSKLTDEIIQKSIADNKLISFETHLFKHDYKNRILMDPQKPNTLYGRGRNCYDTIFYDFNTIYNTNYSVSNFIESESEIILCSCFLTKAKIFVELMDFGSLIIESKKLDLYDTNHKYRIQGGLMERYYATWFLLKKIQFITIKIQHNFYESKRQNNIINKIICKFKSL